MKQEGTLAVGGNAGSHLPISTRPYGSEYARTVERNVAANEGVRRLKRAVTDAIEGKGTTPKVVRARRPKPERRDPKLAPREAVARESKRGGTPMHIREAAIARYNAGETLSSIAADLGKNPRTIREWVYRSGTQRTNHPQPGLITDQQVIADMCALYLSGSSTQTVADTYGISRTAAETALMRGGVKFRTRGETLALMARNAKAAR